MAPIFEGLSETLRPGRREQAMAVSSVGGDVGFELVHEGFATTAGDVSPNALADKMVERLFAHLWDLSDEQWRTHVEPTIAELRDLPDPDCRPPAAWDHLGALSARSMGPPQRQ